MAEDLDRFLEGQLAPLKAFSCVPIVLIHAFQVEFQSLSSAPTPYGKPCPIETVQAV